MEHQEGCQFIITQLFPKQFIQNAPFYSQLKIPTKYSDRLEFGLQNLKTKYAGAHIRTGKKGVKTRRNKIIYVCLQPKSYQRP